MKVKEAYFEKLEKERHQHRHKYEEAITFEGNTGVVKVCRCGKLK